MKNILLSSKARMDVDELLSVEQQFYQQGYEEGKAEALEETKQAGTLLGIQTGYQRLVIMGMAEAYLKYAENTRGKLELPELAELVSNEDESIDKLEKATKKVRNWVQMNSFKGAVPKLTSVDKIVADVVGEQQAKSEDW